MKTLLRKYQLREDASAITQSVPWRGELLRNPTEQQRERVRLEGSCQMTEGEERIRSGDQGSHHTDSEANCRTTQGKEERGVTPQHGYVEEGEKTGLCSDGGSTRAHCR